MNVHNEKLEGGGEIVKVSLSERNLKTLLGMLAHPAHGKMSGPNTLYRQINPKLLLIVEPQTDEKHYGERTPGEDRLIREALSTFEGEGGTLTTTHPHTGKELHHDDPHLLTFE